MIVDTIDNVKFASSLNDDIRKALDTAANTDFSNLADGSYEIDGRRFYYDLQRYTTKPAEEGRLEGHRNYIDVQYIVSGKEAIGYAPLKAVKEETEYDKNKDLVFFQDTADKSEIVLNEGMYAVFFPQDCHAPGLTAACPCDVCKVVFKIRI